MHSVIYITVARLAKAVSNGNGAYLRASNSPSSYQLNWFFYIVHLCITMKQSCLLQEKKTVLSDYCMTAAKYNLTWHQVAFVNVFFYLLHLFHFNLSQNRKPYLNIVKRYNHCNE